MNDRDWLERVAIAADVYTEFEGVNEDQIDAFIEYLFKVYGYTELLKIRKQNLCK
jgi:hypothetical protein